MTAKNVTYHIVGGGIAGLACAKFVKNMTVKPAPWFMKRKGESAAAAILTRTKT